LRLVVPAVAVLLAMAPQAASAHAEVVGSDPSTGSVLAYAPVRVSVYFTQGVQPFGRGLSVVGPDGRRADSGSVAVSGTRLWVPVAAAGEGTYVVAWQVIAADTHPSRGSFVFSVGHGSPPALVAPAAGPLGAALEVAARWLHFAGFSLGFGTVAFMLLVLPAGRIERLPGLGVVLLLAAEPLALLAQAASFSPGAAVDAAALQDALASPFGRLLGLRLAAALLLWALLGAGAVLRPAILAVGVGLALVDAAGAHAQALLPGPLALVVNAAHVAAAATWVGGLAAILWTWPVERSVVTRFGRVALVALAVAVAAGALLAVSEIVTAGNLLGTGFGLALLAKVGAVGLAIMAAALGRRRLELGAMAVVLVVAGLLAAVPSPAP